MRLPKWGDIQQNSRPLSLFLLFSSILLWNRSVSFRCCLFQKALQAPPNDDPSPGGQKFGISRSFAVHISYIKSKDTSPFTYYLKFPSPNTVTQPSADRFMSCTCTYKSTTETCSFPRERTDERPNSHVIASHRISRGRR